MSPNQSTSAPSTAPAGRLPEVPVNSAFFREAEYWTISYCGTVLRLRDSKGLRYLALLLHNPGTRFAARALTE